jgi:hypothetical protein
LREVTKKTRFGDPTKGLFEAMKTAQLGDPIKQLRESSRVVEIGKPWQADLGLSDIANALGAQLKSDLDSAAPFGMPRAARSSVSRKR